MNIGTSGGHALADMKTALVYDIATKIWSSHSIGTSSGSVYPSARSGHTAAISKFIAYYF
jgi:hypothetical protein